MPRSQALINKWTESNLHGDDDAPTPTTKEAHEEVTVSKGADVAAVGEKEEDVTEAPAPPAVAAEAESAVEAQKASAVEVEIGGDAEKGDKDKGDGEDARMEDAPDAEAPAAAAADQ